MQESNSRAAEFLFYGLIIIYLAMNWWFYDQLPEQVANHFDLNGEPNGWSDKLTFVLLNSAIILLLGGLFRFIIWVVPRSPKELINMPNRDFWLAEDRREETIAAIQRYIYYFCDLTFIFLLIIIFQIIKFNIDGSEIFLFWPTILFLIILTFLIIQMLLRFRKAE